MWGNTPMTALDTNDDLFNLWIKDNIIKQLDKQPDYYVQVTVPNEFQPLGKYNIGITAGVETNMIPKDWIVGCNKMNLIIVSSNFSKNTMLTTQYADMQPMKIETKIEVIFEGVDTNVYKKLHYEQMNETKIKNYLDGVNEKFCFLFVGHWLRGDFGQDRKDVGMLIRKFAEGFSGSENKPALILKTSSASFSIKERERLKRNIKNILSDIINPPSVYLVFGTLTDEEMNDLYNHPKIKAMVSFTKGEGFGRPLLEFTMTGKPVLASNWSGHLDFLDDDLSVRLDGELMDVHSSAADQFIIQGSKWFQVSYENAILKMKDVITNYDSYLEKSEKLREKNVKNFSLNEMNLKFNEIMTMCINQQVLDNGLPKLIRI
jgi:glycosyltransferase involved in cell wall biosynthesis